MPSRTDLLHSYQFRSRRVLAALVMRETDPSQSPLRRGVGAVFGGLMVAILIGAAFGIYGLVTKVGGGNPLAIALSINMGASVVDVSPLSTLGALCVAAVADPVEARRLFRALLTGPPPDDERLRLLGELMYQSHASYSACGLGAAGTDRLVGLVREAGPAAGLYGAKITGGGSGGTVAVLGRHTARPAVESIARRYGAEIGQEIMVLGGSSPGATQFGLVRVRYARGVQGRPEL